jgi:trigger factor
VKSTGEPLEGNKVKLSVEVEDAEFAKDIDAAFRKLANEVRLPGFRPGKAPRKILEARIGLAPAREQALRDGIPQYLAKAVREHEVDLISTPDIQITGGAEDGPVMFDATCEVRPTVVVPGYTGLRAELPRLEADDSEIQDAIDAERRRHGTLTVVDRPAARGDYVTIDLQAQRTGEPVPGLNTEDWLYEVGRGWVAPGFDDHLTGSTANDTITFTVAPSGTTEEADFTVVVKNVQELVLPEVSDAWVAEHVPEALAALVDEEPPKVMVDQELQARVEGFIRDLQQRGISVDQWMSATGQDTNTLIEGFREQAIKAVTVDLALRAVADAEQIEVEENDLEAEYERVAARTGMKPKDVRRAYERNDAVFDLVSQLRKSKALDWLLHHVEIVDEAGQPIDRETLLGHTHDHDHDHDHADGEEA